MRVAPKMDIVCRVVPKIIILCLWKRMNKIKHWKMRSFMGLIWQVKYLIRKLIKFLYPWMKVGKESWPNIVNILTLYKSRLHYLSVTWSFLGKNKMKCNTNGACKGNHSLEALAFCIRDENREMVYAKAKGVVEKTNIEVEAISIREATTFSHIHNYMGINIETDSLIMVKVINRQQKVLWGLIEVIEYIWCKLHDV